MHEISFGGCNSNDNFKYKYSELVVKYLNGSYFKEIVEKKMATGMRFPKSANLYFSVYQVLCYLHRILSLLCCLYTDKQVNEIQKRSGNLRQLRQMKKVLELEFYVQTTN